MKSLAFVFALAAVVTACGSARPAVVTRPVTPAMRSAGITGDTVKVIKRGTAKVVIATAEDERDPLVCHEERTLGSRFTKEVCRRQSAIDAERHRTQSALNVRPQIQVNL